MKNEHLVPVNITDLVAKANDKTLRENERMNYVLRLEAIRDYCEQAIKKDKDRKSKEYASSWKATRDICS